MTITVPAAIHAALSALFGGRVYPDEAPQDAGLPFVVYRRTGRTPVGTIHGGMVAAIDVYSIDVWHDTRAGVEGLVPGVMAAIKAGVAESSPLGDAWGADIDMGYEGCSLDYQFVERNV